MVVDWHDTISWDQKTPDHHSDAVREDGEKVECWCCFSRVCFCLRITHEVVLVLMFSGGSRILNLSSCRDSRSVSSKNDVMPPAWRVSRYGGPFVYLFWCLTALKCFVRAIPKKDYEKKDGIFLSDLGETGLLWIVSWPTTET